MLPGIKGRLMGRLRRVEAEPSPVAGPDLGAMTKAELLDEAKLRGVEVKASETKAAILEAIKAAG